MTNIYQAVYVCKALRPMGLPGYNDIVLGLAGSNGGSDMIIHSTLSRFVVGKEYIINIFEKPF